MLKQEISMPSLSNVGKNIWFAKNNKQWNLFLAIFTQPLLQKGSSLKEEILFVCTSLLNPYVNHMFSESISHWQPLPPCSDPVPPSTNRPLMAKYNQVTPVLHYTERVQPSTNQYRLILTQYL